MALLEEHLRFVLTRVVTPSISEQSLFIRGTVLQPEHHDGLLGQSHVEAGPLSS